MGAEASNSAYPGNLRERIFNVYEGICIKGPLRQFDALLACLHQQSMLIFATIALDHPKSALEPFE